VLRGAPLPRDIVTRQALFHLSPQQRGSTPLPRKHAGAGEADATNGCDRPRLLIRLRDLGGP
jgi:hypothetical protein